MPSGPQLSSPLRLHTVAGLLSPVWRRPGRHMTPPTAPVVSRRWSSSEPSQYSMYTADLQNAFFKTFGRPIAKVCLMAIFTYQLVFFGWTKLDQDDIRAEREATIESLEAQVKELQTGKKA